MYTRNNAFIYNIYMHIIRYTYIFTIYYYLLENRDIN